MVDGVKADPPGSDESSDPLKLALAHVILEDDVVGEVHAADGFERGRPFAGEGPTFVGRQNLYSHGLRDWVLVILHLQETMT